VGRTFLPIVLLAMTLSAPARAQTTDPLYRSWEWDAEPLSARAAGLGGAVAAAASDAGSAAFHPASLSLSAETDVRLSVRYADAGSVALDRTRTRWTLAQGAVALPLGLSSGIGAYYRSPRSLGLEIQPTTLPDGSIDGGRLDAVARETGVAFGTALTPRLRVGVRLGAAHLDLDGEATTEAADGSLRAATSTANAWEPSVGVGLLFAAHQSFHASLTWDRQVSWRARWAGDAGSGDHEVVAPARLAGGLLFRPSSVVWITGQLDWVRWSQVRSALVSPDERPPAFEFALDDSVDGRLGLEMRAEYGESPLWSRAVFRLGLHFRSRGLLEYVGPDSVEQARFPGGKRSTEWSLGFAYGPVEVGWISRKPSNVWVIGVRQFF
jgi:hypothetical protein